MAQQAMDLEDWIKVLDRIPFVGSIKRDFTRLRGLLYERRAPRIAVIGPARSGKTALANALLAAAALPEEGLAGDELEWVGIDADGRRLRWLEIPLDLDDEDRASLRRAFEESLPDVILAVCAASQVASSAEATGAVLSEVRGLAKELLKGGDKKEVPALAVLLRVDEVPPGDAVVAPYPPEKLTAIDRQRQAFAKAAGGLDEAAVFAASAAPLADPEGPSGRWNLEEVATAIFSKLPDDARLEAVRSLGAGREAQREVARTIVNSASSLAVTVGLMPIPGDVFILMPLQAIMVTGIAYVSGRPWNRRAAVEWIASLGVVGGAGIGLRFGAQQLVKLIPGAGALVSASVAGAGTLALGQSAMAYFIDGPGSGQRRLELTAGTIG